jgi:pimeloyl-ACP methyl ester carboxylesterase
MQVNGVEVHYEDTGVGADPVVFAHGLLWSGRMFDAQVAALRARHRCVTFDFRGQGQSEVARAGYDMETLTQDAAALIEALGVRPCHFVGLSMGGFVGLRLAARRPELIRSLLLLSTSADRERLWNALRLRALAFVARWLGLRLVAGRVMRSMFGRTFLADPVRAAEGAAWRRVMLANHPVGTRRAILGVLWRRSVAGELARIQAPTLILVGDEDDPAPPAKARRIHQRIGGSRLVVIPNAGHTLPVEAPEAVNAALAEFLAGVSA